MVNFRLVMLTVTDHNFRKCLTNNQTQTAIYFFNILMICKKMIFVESLEKPMLN